MGLADLSCAQVRFVHNALRKTDVPSNADMGAVATELATTYGKKAVLKAAEHYSMHTHLVEFDGDADAYVLTARTINIQEETPSVPSEAQTRSIKRRSKQCEHSS